MPIAALKDRVLALAGLLQSVQLVQEMANNGQAQTRPLAACVDSLFRFDADSTEEVYGGVRALEPGLRRAFGQTGSWIDILKTQLDLPAEFEDTVSKAWQTEQARASAARQTLDPVEFARAVADRVVGAQSS